MQRYALAFAAVALTAVVGLALQSVTDTNPVAFSLFVAPILTAGLFGGLGPSFMATIGGGIVAEYFFRRPYRHWPDDSAELLPLGLYLLIGVGIAVLSDRLWRARQDVQRREREFATLFRMTPIGIGIATDPECKHITVNPAFAELLHLPPSGNASLSAPADQRPAFRVTQNGREVATEDLPLQRAARLGVDVRHVELDVDHADGTRVSLYEYATPLVDDEGNVRGAIGAFLDITERRKTEEALRQALDDNGQLYRQAQEANQLKDEFLTTLSHELKTPLNALLGWIQLLRNGQLSPERQVRALDAIERSADLQARLTADLLDVSAAMTGKLRLDLGIVAPAALLEGVVDSLRPAAEDKGVSLKADVAAALPQMRLDAGRIQQVVWNLLSNAIKFTPVGGAVRLAAARADDGIVITVSDSGIGIRPVFLPYVFDRFRQADAGPTREHPGLGLGLSIVKHLVELHTGTVTVESGGEDRGSTFTVWLPATSPTAAPTPPPGPDPSAAPDRQSP
ncbi:MAG: ATP-binding protein [Vicinamibacterales bacterium]